MALTSRLLVEFARHVRAIGAEPVVLIIPELWQVEVLGDPARRAALARARRRLPAAAALLRLPCCASRACR